MTPLGLLIIGALTVIVPVVLKWMNTREARADKLADWARQDQVAERLLAAQEKTIEKTDEVAMAAKERADSVDKKLNKINETTDVIHGLTNSRLVVAIMGIVVLKRKFGIELSAEELVVEKGEKEKADLLVSVAKQGLADSAVPQPKPEK